MMQVTQQLTIVMQVYANATNATDATNAANATRQLTSLAIVTSTPSSSMQPSSLNQDEPTQAEINSVCEMSMPQKSNQKHVLTKCAHDNTKKVAARALNGMFFSFMFFSSHISLSTTSGTQEWLVLLMRAALPQTGIVCYVAVLKQVGRDKLKQHISDLPDWASPPKPALKTVIMAATGATDIKWDPMEENGLIALNFEYKQPWMTQKNVKIKISYKQHSTLPSTT